MDNLVSKLCSYMGIFALVQTFLPPALRNWLDRWLDQLWEKLFRTADPHVQLEIVERGSNHSSNIFYREVALYLSSLRSALDLHTRLKVFRADGDSSLSFSLPDDETLEDCFNGAPVWWTHTCMEKEKGDSNSHGDERKSFTLKFLKNDRGIILPAYLDYVTKVASDVERKSKQRYLYTNNYGDWNSTPLNLPSSFATLALDAGVADRIRADLDAFSQGEDFYHRNGRAWKRGYLLYGPPGTGKSSMIAAFANHLQFDIYDLDLTKVFDNAELKSLLMQTTRKSIIVIEDMDCTVQFPDRTDAVQSSDSDPSSNETGGGSRLTLSGLLNFTDGLWSSCGEERIFIFTTNHKDRLDPALLRPGRMDMHILLSYCSFPALKKMASNYLGIQHHRLYPELEKVMAGALHQVTPAAVAEILISNEKDPDMALEQVMAAIQGSLPAQEDPLKVDNKTVQENHQVNDKMDLGLKKRRLRRVLVSLLTSKHFGKQTEREPSPSHKPNFEVF